jgi:acetolactate synthase-1/2/3 large subunit
MIVFSNGGYASIRLSQRAYFDGNYIGCDAESGIGLPNWEAFFGAYGIPVATLSGKLADNDKVQEILNTPGPGAVIVKIHEDQAFFPKLTSRIFSDGTMKSNPLHLLNPPLSNELADDLLRYIPAEQRYAE